LADQEGLKHRLTGGWWCSAGNEKWLHAGSGVTSFLAEHPVLQKLLGWTDPKLLKHGMKIAFILNSSHILTLCQVISNASV
jgi:hypothetical protein